MKAFLGGWLGGFIIVLLLSVFFGTQPHLPTILFSSLVGAFIGTAAAHLF